MECDKNRVDLKNKSLTKQIQKLQEKITSMKAEHKANSDSSQQLIQTLQSNLKQLQCTKRDQLNSLKEAQQTVREKENEIKKLAEQHNEEIAVLNEKLLDKYQRKLESNDEDFEQVNKLQNELQSLQQKHKKLQDAHDDLTSLRKQLQSELDGYEQKTEENELKLITLQNKHDQLHAMNQEYEQTVNEYEATLKQRDGQISALQKQIDELARLRETDENWKSEVRAKYEEIECMYNGLLIQQHKLKQTLHGLQDEKVDLQKQLDAATSAYDNEQRQCLELKQRLERSIQNASSDHLEAKKRKFAVDTPKGNTMEIRTRILQQELLDEQRESKKLKQMIDALKIENSTLMSDINKLRKEVDGGNLSDERSEDANALILRLQNVSLQNDKLSKKVKVQEAKIAMYRKKLNRDRRDGRKQNEDDKENMHGNAEHDLSSNISTLSTASILSSASSLSSNSGSRRDRKRKYAQIVQDPHRVDDNRRVKRAKCS